MQAKRGLCTPHPIAYQGSKRKIALDILKVGIHGNVKTLYEPFAGSAAITLAAANLDAVKNHHINDSLTPLSEIWALIVSNPESLIHRYESIWMGHIEKPLEHYYDIRKQFNYDREPAKLLYLLARCVKSAVRFNQSGEFNQSVDKRRLGTRPERMRKEIEGAHYILRNKTTVTAGDYRDATQSATSKDLVYLDPPWEGTSGDRNNRYHELLDKAALIEELASLNRRAVRYLLSFDGRLGKKSYGEILPESLGLTRLEINAGRSSQATFLGRDETTYESLYLSPSLVERLDNIEQKVVLNRYLPRTNSEEKF